MLKIDRLPSDLLSYGTQNFDKMFSLRPEKSGSVLVYNRDSRTHEEKQIYRHYMSYLESPAFDSQVEKSYMFSNFDDEFRSKDMPELFEPFLDFAKSIDSRYNQITVNWYDKEHYIEMHRDCTAKFVEETSPILTINLNETDILLRSRSFILENIETREAQSYLLRHGTCLTMLGECQKTHRHGVGPGAEKRISITFRMIK